MRKHYDCLLAGTMLALIVAAPTLGFAQSRVQSVGAPPPSLNGQTPVRRREMVLPVPSQQDDADHDDQDDNDRPSVRAQDKRLQEQRAQDQRAQEQRAQDQRAQEQRAHEQRAQEQRRLQEQRAQDQRMQEQRAQEQRAQEQRAQEQRAQAPAPAPREADNDRTLGASDSQITDRLRVSAKQARIERATDRQAIESLYAGRNYAPLWIRDGRLTGRAKDAIARLKSAADEGLDAADYSTPDFNGGADALAQADIKLTSSVLDFARNMESGRIAPTRVAVEIDYGTKPVDSADILRKIAGASDINSTLDSFDPPHEGFRALKRKLAELRNASVGEPNDRIADGAPIKPGAKDPRVPMLRARLGVAGKKVDDILYDKNLFNAVRAVQQRHDIKPTGVIDSKTIAAINGPKPGQQVDTVLANMERWRWLPRDLGATYVMVNVPDFTLKVVNDHRIVWRTKIVSGKPQTPTPLTSASMDTVIVNPSWYVPQSIIQNELLPQYESDPKIFDRLGLEVKKGPDGNINVVQPPGAANALGRIKFNFPNKFQVYLHDTPEKNLFRADRRAFSHGCMRVEDPTMFGQVMLHLAMAGPTPDSRQLMTMFGKDEKIFKLQRQPRVHLTYQTAFVDDEGKLQIRDDIYGMDARIHAIMHGDERKIADVPPPQDPKRDQATAKNNQEILRRVERREALNPFHFFEQLFR